MSEHEDYMRERQRLDTLREQGYVIINIHEDLDGAKVTLMGADKGEGPCIVQLLTAEARKYIGTMILVELGEEI